MLNTCHLLVLHFDFFLKANYFSYFTLILGRLPFIRANKFVIAEMDPIVAFVNTKVFNIIWTFSGQD